MQIAQTNCLQCVCDAAIRKLQKQFPLSFRATNVIANSFLFADKLPEGNKGEDREAASTFTCRATHMLQRGGNLFLEQLGTTQQSNVGDSAIRKWGGSNSWLYLPLNCNHFPSHPATKQLLLTNKTTKILLAISLKGSWWPATQGYKDQGTSREASFKEFE